MASTPTPTTPNAQAQATRMETTREVEHQLVGARDITFRTEHLEPPSALYVTEDDDLFIQAINSVPNQVIVVAARTLLPDGRVQPNQWQISLPSTRTLISQTINVTEGFILGVAVLPTVVPTRRGQTWVSLALRRGPAATGFSVQQLVQDYVDSFSGTGWPLNVLRNSLEGRGYLNSMAVTQPAAATDWSFTVPSNTHWIPYAINHALTCSAGVGNRKSGLLIMDPTNIVFFDVQQNQLTAGQNLSYIWARLLGTTQETVTSGGGMTRALPDVRLGPGWIIRSTSTGLQAGDQYSGIQIVVEEFLSV